MKHAYLIGLCALIAAPALAQSQQDVLSGTLLPGWQMSDGHYMAGVSLTLAPHWKTYWRAPGEAGIPPLFDWSGSRNVKSVALHWPSPEVIVLNGMQSIGYLDALVLPVEVVAIDPAQPIDLNLQMQLGICKDICMPAQLSLTTTLDTTSTQTPAIAASLRNGPMTAKAAGLDHIACNVSPIEDGLRIEAQMTLPRQGTPETVVFETSDQAIWVAEATQDRAGTVLTAATELVGTSGEPFVLDRSAMTVTVIGQGHSVEIKGCPAP